ncbi:MAG: ribosome biogenesis factor YjgA [Lysobacterales bacterium]
MTEDDISVSKSQRKREANQLFELGGRLVNLSPAQLDGLTLEPDVLDLIEKVRGITRFVARKRELMFLAKQLRRADRSELLEEMEKLDQPHLSERAALHRLEAWRDFLLENGRTAVNQLCAHHPDVDRPKLLSLIKKSLAERNAGRPPAAARQLFKALREMDQSSELPTPHLP